MSEPHRDLPQLEFQKPVKELHRRLSKPPMKRIFFERVAPLSEVSMIADQRDDPEMSKKYEVRDGRRLIIEGIPVKDLRSGEPLADRSIQVFKNPEGYLVAEEVVNDQNNRGGSVILERTEQGSAVVKEIIPDNQLKDNEKMNLPGGSVQLIDLEYKWPRGGGSYSSVHIGVSTPSDEGNEVNISLVGFPNKLPEPIKFREVSEIL
jgi:hypothetical protein